MQESLLEIRGTITQEEKDIQLQNLKSAMLKMLILEGFSAKEVENEEDMFDIINRLDIETYLNIKQGEHGPCLRPGCNYKSHANFYKAKDSDIWLYKCPCCNAGRDVITLTELIAEVFRATTNNCNHRIAMHLIKRAFSVEYLSDFYKNTREMLEYNTQKLNEAKEGSYLKKLIRKRRLDEFYEDYKEIASMYIREDKEYNYSFYASRRVILDYFKNINKESKSNSIMEKINLLDALGFITKIETDEAVESVRKKIRTMKDEKLNFELKDVSIYQIRKITDEELLQAEEYAKAIINNKIYRNKASIEKSIQETCSFTKAEESFLNRAKKAISDEIESKGYIVLSTLASKIDKKGKFYKKEEKEEFLKLLQDRVIAESNLKKIKATETNKKKYNMKRVKDREIVLVKSDVEIEIAERIRVEKSVRKAKEIKRKSISSKKKKVELTVVRTYMENGCKMAEMSDGSVDMLDIPF